MKDSEEQILEFAQNQKIRGTPSSEILTFLEKHPEAKDDFILIERIKKEIGQLKPSDKFVERLFNSLPSGKPKMETVSYYHYFLKFSVAATAIAFLVYTPSHSTKSNKPGPLLSTNPQIKQKNIGSSVPYGPIFNQIQLWPDFEGELAQSENKPGSAESPKQTPLPKPENAEQILELDPLTDTKDIKANINAIIADYLSDSAIIEQDAYAYEQIQEIYSSINLNNIFNENLF